MAASLGFSAQEVADSLGICLRTVRYAIASGNLQVIRVSKGIVRVTPEAVADWIGRSPKRQVRRRNK